MSDIIERAEAALAGVYIPHAARNAISELVSTVPELIAELKAARAEIDGIAARLGIS